MKNVAQQMFSLDTLCAERWLSEKRQLLRTLPNGFAEQHVKIAGITPFSYLNISKNIISLSDSLYKGHFVDLVDGP